MPVRPLEAFGEGRTVASLTLEASRDGPRVMGWICAYVTAARPGTAAETVRARVYELVDRGFVARVAPGVYVAVDGPAALVMLTGDSTEALEGMEADFADLVVTDPPDWMGAEAHAGTGTTRPHGALGGRTYRMTRLDERWLRAVYRVLKTKRGWNALNPLRRERGDLPLGGGALVLILPNRTKTTRPALDRLYALAESVGFVFQGEDAWDHLSLGMGYAFGRCSHGLVALFTKGEREGVGFDLAMPTVLRHRAVRNPCAEGAEEHEAEKPVGLVLDVIGFCTREGDVVVDPFAGRARWAREAQRRGRHIVLVEAEERWMQRVAQEDAGPVSPIGTEEGIA